MFLGDLWTDTNPCLATTRSGKLSSLNSLISDTLQYANFTVLVDYFDQAVWGRSVLALPTLSRTLWTLTHKLASVAGRGLCCSGLWTVVSVKKGYQQLPITHKGRPLCHSKIPKLMCSKCNRYFPSFHTDSIPQINYLFVSFLAPLVHS